MPKKARILKITNEAPGTRKYKVDYKVNHDPGQFVELSILNIGEAPFSIGSYSRKYMELTIRSVGNVTDNLATHKVGDTIYIRGPYGHGYPMDKFKNKNLIIIGGGTGVAPLRSVIEYIEQHRKDYSSVDIFLGYRSPKDILFKYDLKKWNKLFNLQITVDKPDKTWKGCSGVVTCLLNNAKFNKDNSVVITCGPPIMIKFVIQTLKNLKFNDEQIYVSFERLMKCGVGKCGHCMVGKEYTCLHGPVFNYKDVKDLED